MEVPMDRWLQRMQAHWNRHGRTYAYKHGNTVQLRLMVCKLDEEDLKELLNTYGGERYVRCWRAASDAAMEYLYDMRDGMSEVRLMEFAVYVDFWQLLHVSKRGRGYRV